MDAITYLDNEHKELLQLITELENSGSTRGSKEQDMFTQIRTFLKLHELVEEKILYPELKREDKDLILEAVEEHHVADKLLDELSQTSFKSDVWKAKLAVLRECLEHHIKEEREEVFPLAIKHYGKEKLQQMVAEMEQLKNQQHAAATN